MRESTINTRRNIHRSLERVRLFNERERPLSITVRAVTPFSRIANHESQRWRAPQDRFDDALSRSSCKSPGHATALKDAREGDRDLGLITARHVPGASNYRAPRCESGMYYDSSSLSNANPCQTFYLSPLESSEEPLIDNLPVQICTCYFHRASIHLPMRTNTGSACSIQVY